MIFVPHISRIAPSADEIGRAVAREYFAELDRRIEEQKARKAREKQEEKFRKDAEEITAELVRLWEAGEEVNL